MKTDGTGTRISAASQPRIAALMQELLDTGHVPANSLPYLASAVDQAERIVSTAASLARLTRGWRNPLTTH